MKHYKSSPFKSAIYIGFTTFIITLLVFIVEEKILSGGSAFLLFLILMLVIQYPYIHYVSAISFIVEDNKLIVKRFNTIIADYQIEDITVTKENIIREDASSYLEASLVLLSIYSVFTNLYKIEFTYNDSAQKLNLSALSKIDAIALLNDIKDKKN